MNRAGVSKRSLTYLGKNNLSMQAVGCVRTLIQPPVETMLQVQK